MRSLRGRDTVRLDPARLDAVPLNTVPLNTVPLNSQAGPRRRSLDAVDEIDAWPRIVGEQEIAVEVDVVHQACDLRAGGDPQARLDHAAEHQPEVERACGVRHPHRFADAAGLRELDVDAVRAVG